MLDFWYDFKSAIEIVLSHSIIAIFFIFNSTFIKESYSFLNIFTPNYFFFPIFGSFISYISLMESSEYLSQVVVAFFTITTLSIDRVFKSGDGEFIVLRRDNILPFAIAMISFIYSAEYIGVRAG